MQEVKDLIELKRLRSAKRILFLSHAVRQLARPERMISPTEIRKVIENGEIIEDYPDDVRGHSCLIMGEGEDGRL